MTGVGVSAHLGLSPRFSRNPYLLRAPLHPLLIYSYKMLPGQCCSKLY